MLLSDMSKFLIILAIISFIVCFVYGFANTLFFKTRTRKSYRVRYIGDNIIYLPCIIKSRFFFDKVIFFETELSYSSFPFLYFFSKEECGKFLDTL
jgi:hypothetical protein